MLALASAAFAANVNSVTTTASTTSATTGTSVVITVVSSSDSDTVSNVQIQLVKDSGTGNGSCSGASDFSISDPASPYYYTASVPTTGVTKTFTFTVGSCGTYTYHVADSWSGGSKSSTSDTIEFIAPTALTVQPSATDVQANQSQSFTLSIDITNSQGSQITTSYALTAASGLSVSGDPTSSGAKNISASSTATLTWIITHSTCFTGGKSVTLQLGDNTNASYIVVTGNSSCGGSTDTTTTTSSGGGSGGGGSSGIAVTHSAKKHVVKIDSISANNKADVDITKSYETDVKKISINVKNAVKNVEIIITKPDSKPADVTTPTENVYHYLKVDKANVTDNDINNVTIDFQVEKSWIASNDVTTISLSRYTTSWTKLSTKETGDNATHRFYRAVSPGLSVFAITGEKASAVAQQQEEEQPPTAQCGNGIVESGEECDDSVTGTCQSMGYKSGTLKCTNCRIDASKCMMELVGGIQITKEMSDISVFIVVIIFLIVIIAGIFYYHGRQVHKEIKYSFKAKK